MDKGLVWVGTSGWVYKQWAGNFYPKGWPKKNEFGYYVRHFPTVEINATFYRLPTLSMVRGWHDKAPAGFLFAVKGSRFLTHIKRLTDTSPGLQKYFRRLVPLADRTGPVLWQLPPSFAKTEETTDRLERFLDKLPRSYRHAVEFRHPSWMIAETFHLLREHRVANVWLSSLRMPADYTLTADFVYLRFHGLEGGAYHDYTNAELQPWADQLADAAAKGLPSYVYFNNDLNTRAPLNAAALMSMLGHQAVKPKAAEPAESLPQIAPPKLGDESWPSWQRRSKSKLTPHRKPRGVNKMAAHGRATQPALATARTAARPPSASARRRGR